MTARAFRDFPDQSATSGGPGRATETLAFKAYRDGVEGLDLGGSAAHSIILMLIVVALTVPSSVIEGHVHVH